MSISTRSAFYYGCTVDRTNFALDFSEGGDEIAAEIAIGSYTLTSLAAAVEAALNAVGSLVYTVSVDRATRRVTIAATGTFELLTNTGGRLGVAAWGLLGYATIADHEGGVEYEGEAGAGEEFLPQALLDNYIPSSHWKGKQDASVYRSASGIVQSVYFGDEAFFQMNVRLQCNKASPGNSIIEGDALGETKLRQFMDFLITKGLVEFMPDRASRSTFHTLMLESTPKSRQGTEYQLQKLPKVAGYYSTGPLVFREQSA